MKIIIYGAGAIGSLFGSLIYKAGFDVTLIGKKDHITKIQEHGLIVTGKKTMTSKIKAHKSLDNVENPDLIILTTKAYDTSTAIQECKPIITDETRVLSIQNGLGNEEIISKHISRNKILGGVTSCAAEFNKPGKIKFNAYSHTTIGNYFTKNDDFVKKVKAIFDKSEIKTDISNKIKTDIYQKLIVNIGINALGTIADVTNGILSTDNNLKSIMKKIVNEAIIIAKAEHINLTKPFDQVIKIAEITSNNKNSMLQDINKKKKTEIDYMNGKIVELGRKHNIPTPYNELITNLIKFKENE